MLRLFCLYLHLVILVGDVKLYLEPKDIGILLLKSYEFPLWSPITFIIT